MFDHYFEPAACVADLVGAGSYLSYYLGEGVSYDNSNAHGYSYAAQVPELCREKRALSGSACRCAQLFVIYVEIRHRRVRMCQIFWTQQNKSIPCDEYFNILSTVNGIHSRNTNT
jgi:hypothetical protein